MHCKEIKTEDLDKKFVYLPNGEHHYSFLDVAIIPNIYVEKWLSIYNDKYFIDYKKISAEQGNPKIYEYRK